MSKTQKGLLTKYLTGGDLMSHRFQLLWANLKRSFFIGTVVYLFSSWVLISLYVKNYEWYVFKETMIARFWCFVHLPNYHLDFMRPDGVLVDSTTSAAIVKYVMITPGLAGYFSHVVWYLCVAALISIGAILSLVVINVQYGHDAQTDDFLRGQKLVDAKTLAKQITNPPIKIAGVTIPANLLPHNILNLLQRYISKQTTNPSPIQIAGVPIPIDLLCRNNLIVGGMGTGKTVVIDQMIEDARKWGKKMVIYDKTGEFTQKFFRPGIDILLSPIDARCADWSIFADLRKITDPAMVSTFFVPENKHSNDPIWDNAARMLLEDLITIVRNNGGSMADIKDIITQYSLEDLSKLLKQHNAPSCGTINPGNAKGSESVRLTLIAQPAVRFFSFFDKTNASFSVREFIRREDDACLFLVSSSTQHEVAKPFISAWVELALAEAMSMPPTTDIRLMFFLDELASLSKLKALDIAFTEARKYGIVSTVGLQNLSQSDELYGENMTKVFVANLQNKLILRTEEQSSAERLANTLGKEEIKENDQSLSFGVESSRDGTSLGGKRVEPNLVTYTEIMVLPDMTGYLKIAGPHPIAKVSFEYKARLANVEGYIEREGLNLPAPAPVVLPEQAFEPVEPIDQVEPVANVFPMAQDEEHRQNYGW